MNVTVIHVLFAFQVNEQRRKLTAAEAQEGSSRLPFLPSNVYPKYYQNDFHYQTDGWFSSESAKTYNIQTEMLFFGQQDAMQRSTFIPMAKHAPSTSFRLCTGVCELKIVEFLVLV